MAQRLAGRARAELRWVACQLSLCACKPGKQRPCSATSDIAKGGGLLMIPRFLRHSRLLLAAVVLALVTSGSLAIAHDSGSHDHGNHHKRFSAWDEQWLMMSIQGDLFEIQGGKIAQQKGESQQVRDLGARLVADHSKSLEDSTDLAEQLGIDVPTEPSPTQQWQLRVVSSFSGNAFDRWYSDLEVQDHVQDIKEAQDEVDKGRNPDIREDAEDEIPTLEQHLELAKAALAAVGGPVQP
jgi:putative membrane protein